MKLLAHACYDKVTSSLQCHSEKMPVFVTFSTIIFSNNNKDLENRKHNQRYETGRLKRT